MGSHPLKQGDLPDPEIEPKSPALQADCFPSESPGKSYKKKEASNELRGLSPEMQTDLKFRITQESFS